jgi:hypothetical protein
MAAVGNGFGVSHQAAPIYDELIGRWSERHFRLFARLLAEDRELASRLQLPSCAQNCRQLVRQLRPRTPNVLIQRALDLIGELDPRQLGRLIDVGEYRQALRDLATR